MLVCKLIVYTYVYVKKVAPYVLNGWWHSSLSSRARAIRTVLDRARASVAVLCKLDIINRYSESARL